MTNPSQQKRALRPPGSYEDARRLATASRLRRTTFSLLLPLALAIAVHVHVFGDSAPLRALGLIGMLALTTVTHLVVLRHGAGGRGLSLAVVFVVTFCGLLLVSLGEIADAHHHVRLLAVLVMGGAIVLPWGLVPQTVVATCVAVAYTQLPAWFPLDAHAVHEHAVSLFDILALSVIGAWTLDRQRRAVFAEREQGRVILRRQQLLLDAASELNASLDVEATVATIARMAERTFDVDTIALVLVDEARGVLRTAAVVGDTNEADRETENLEIPLAVLAPLVDEIRRRQVVCVPDALAEFGALIRERFGVRASLYAAIEHESTLLGYLVLNYRRGGASFDQADATLARGFATCCAIALAKSRLVTDLRRADRVKNEFVSTMSHELRTPLHVILGYADLLDDVLTDPEGRRGIDRIRVAGRELLELIEATLDVNRLESGEDAATLAPVAVRDLWDELGGEFTALPHAESVRLVWQVEDGLVALADRRKLKIIVKNLVGNALKFTRAGEVVASAVRDGQRCVVRVCDTGIGIPPEHLDGIFEKFRQVDSSDRRSFGGVGLGLYIVRKLVEQLGGTVEVASTVGRGTTFTITLPLASARGVAAA